MTGKGSKTRLVPATDELIAELARYRRACTGSPWRDLPVAFGRWHTVYMRFARWRRDGVWQRVAHSVAGEGEIEHILIDSTIVRAHQHSAGALKKVARKRSDAPAVD